MDKEIIINPKFDLNVIFSANFHLWFSRIGKFFAIIYGFIMLLVLLVFTASDKSVIDQLIADPTRLVIIFLPLSMILIIYLRSKEILKNYRLKEDIEFIFNKDYFQERGETFDVKHFWDKLYKITERKTYFLIYQNKSKASVIPKKELINDQYKELHSLFRSLPIKKSLK